MNQADFQYLVRCSEQDAEKNPDAFRRHVQRFALWGLLYVAATVLLGAGLLVAGFILLARGYYVGGAMLLGASPSLLWLGLRALWLKIPLPQGLVITRNQAPDLFTFLDRIRRKMSAPPVDRVIITDEYEAFISEHQRWIFFGKSTRTLALGLPLVLSVEPLRLLSVLVHEYAHLRGGDGRVSARLYRIHHAMERLSDHIEYTSQSASRDVFSAISQRFLDWFAPRFLAKSLAVARQEEYLADQWAAELCGAEVTSSALMEISLLADYVPREHWIQFWQNATDHAIPPQLPYAWLAARRLRPPPPHAIQESLYHLRHETSSADSTHPRTVDRVTALGDTLRIPTASTHHAGRLLGYGLHAAIAHYDRIWWQNNRQTWQRMHAQARLWQEEVTQLQLRYRQLQSAELHRLAQLLQRTRRQAQAEVVYARLRHADPQHPQALWHDIINRAERTEFSAMPLLDQLASHHPAWRERACLIALDLLERCPHVPNRSSLRRRWLRRQEDMQKLRERFQEEMSQASLVHTTSAHQLSVYEQQDFIESAQRLRTPVHRIWLMRNNSRTMPWYHMYLAIVEPARGREDEIHWEELNQQLDVPGDILCAPLQWWDKLPGSRRLRREDAVYDHIRHRLQLPHQTDMDSIL